MDRGQRGKKGNQQDDFQKLLARPCPLHSKGRHTILECINLRKSLQEHQLEEDKKKKDKQDDEDRDCRCFTVVFSEGYLEESGYE